MLLGIIVTSILHIGYILACNRNGSTYSQKRSEPNRPRCLTGYMTDVQMWVDEDGCLTSAVDIKTTIDLSEETNAVPVLHQQINRIFKNGPAIRFLSLARCKLSRVPMVFQLKGNNGRSLSDTVEYLTLYGNQFLDISSPGEQYDMALNATHAREISIIVQTPAISTWSAGFLQVNFSHLRELDLRKCNIQNLNDYVFKGMTNLQALYLSENEIAFIGSKAFAGLSNLLHLDLSRNIVQSENDLLEFESKFTFNDLGKLRSLDLSFTKIMRRNTNIFKTLGKEFQRLSLCATGINRLEDSTFNTTHLKYLDVSNNNGILSGPNVLKGLENSLEVFYANAVGLKSVDIFHNFRKLQILRLFSNEIPLIPKNVARSWKNLKILDLTKNRMTNWFDPTFSHMRQLQFLSLKENNINVLADDMISDIKNVSYIALSGNFFVCSCHMREVYELALRNENKSIHHLIRPMMDNRKSLFSYHTGFEDFNQIIINRNNVTKECLDKKCDDRIEELDLELEGNFLLVDFAPFMYTCLSVPDGKILLFSVIETCKNMRRGIDLDDTIDNSYSVLLALIILPTVVFPILIFSYIFRRNFKYCFITMRNSALLSLINKDTTIDDGTIFNYDVFVSYCNEDRNWVLDHLLPHVEKDCNVSVCLHERDFQVGLSILENIVSCMDRSRSIMLIISKKFLLSQWCQFEMHLAQHRLLETRREDLILVLLEDIPRRLRPTTLHYLMLTKTYIVWPSNSSEEPVFWRRLKKSLITYRLCQPENISLA